MLRAGVVALVFLAACDDPPPPDLATLPERARRGEDGAFKDLLKLRQSGGPGAVPALIRVLDDHRGSTRIFGFAAAQALFHIGGEDAHAALRGACAADGYPWWTSMDYTFHWKMDARERDRFIATYLLPSSNDKLRARLTVDRAAVKRGDELTFTLEITNTTREPLGILTCDGQASLNLVLRDPEGRFSWVQTAPEDNVIPKTGWRKLEAGAAAEFKYVRAFLPCRGGRKRGVAYEQIKTEGGSGRFDVIAVVSGGTCVDAGDPPATLWIGRVACEPVTMTISE